MFSPVRLSNMSIRSVYDLELMLRRSLGYVVSMIISVYENLFPGTFFGDKFMKIHGNSRGFTRIHASLAGASIFFVDVVLRS